MSDIFEKTLEIFKEKLDLPPEQEIRLNSTFEELEIDSLDLLEVIVAIEMEFDIEIPDEALKNIKDVESAVNLVESLIGA